MANWPVQAQCPQFYGSVEAISKQLVPVTPPWKMYFDGKPVTHISMHRKCAGSFTAILNEIWERVGQSQAEIDRIGMSKFSGSYNKRKIGGSSVWSMHAYGCAVDFDSANNWLGDTTPAMDRRVVEIFEKHGWEWGGHWKKPDGMHFQAAWTRVNPPRLGALTVQPKATTKQLAQVSTKVSFLSKVQTWLGGIGTAATGIFTADTLGAFQGWAGIFAGLGKFALVALGAALLYMFITRVVLEMIKKDHDEGRWTPSGTTELPVETSNAVDEQPVVVV